MAGLNMDKITFKANISMNIAQIKSASNSDKYFALRGNQKKLEDILARVQSLSKLREDSGVNIIPRVHSSQLNLLCTVSDVSNTVCTPISERYARKITGDEAFGNRFINSIITAIKNVEKTRQSFLEIKECLSGLNNIADDGFLANLPRHILNSFNKNTNPTERIISILKRISREYPEEISHIKIKNIKAENEVPKQSRIYSYFCVKNRFGEKRVPIHIIMKDAIDNLFNM